MLGRLEDALSWRKNTSEAESGVLGFDPALAIVTEFVSYQLN